MLNVASFLPTYVNTKEWVPADETLDSTDVAFIIAVFSVAQIIFAPFNASINNYFGSKNTILIGFFMLTSTTFGLGLMSYIENATTFKYVGIAIRFFMGQGDILLQITCYTVITSIFSDNVMKYISYIELVVGMGLALGPALGSVVYGFLQYSGTMYFFGALNTCAMLCCYFFIPSELNKTVSYEEIAEFEAELEDIDLGSEKRKIKVTWGTVLGNKHVVFALLTCFFGTYNLVFFAGYLAEYLTTLQFNENNVGYVMAC